MRLLKRVCTGPYSWMEKMGKTGQKTQIKRVIKNKTTRSVSQPRITPANPEATPKPQIQLVEKSAKKPDAAGAGRVSPTN